MRVAAYQMEIVWEDRAANFARVRTMAERAVGLGADVLVLPEMFSVGFSLNPAVTAEDDDGPTSAFLSALAAELQLNVIGGAVLRGQTGKGRNTALVYSRQGALIARYAKVHLFSFAHEERHHEPGNGPVVFDLDGVSCTCAICYDLRFPELFRLTAPRTAVAFVIASWPNGRQRHWDLLLPARALENQQYVVGVNRVGHGGGLTYTGGTAIWSPLAEPLAQGGDGEALVLADIELAEVERVRAVMPFLADRRVFTE